MNSSFSLVLTWRDASSVNYISNMDTLRLLISKKALNLMLASVFFSVSVIGCLAPCRAYSQSLRGSGEFEFSLDRASFFDNGDKSTVEIYIQISNNEIRFKEVKGRWSAKVQMSLELRDKNGAPALGDQRTFEFKEDNEENTKTPLRFQTAIIRYQLDPGTYTLNCRLEDLYSPKITLLGIAKQQRKSSSIKDASINISGFNAEEVNLSDPKFLWDINPASGRKILHPNPPRMYGLYNDTLRVYYELYVPATAGGVKFSTIILNANGEIVRRSEKTLSEGSASVSDSKEQINVYQLVISEDLTTFPAGTYTLFGQFATEGASPVRIRGGRFSVAWEMRTWEEPKSNLLAEARFLMNSDDFDSFKKKNRADQEKILKKLWRDIDPNPATGVNEAYDEFKRRLDYVNANYTDYQTGAFTDRGMIYLKYGKPDEIIVDALPMNRETTSDAVAKVLDKFRPVIFSTHGGRPTFAKPSREIVMDRRRVGVVGEGGNVAYPYELWIYDRQGKALLPRDEIASPDIGLRFIFIDREGYGRYKLEVSSSLLDVD